MREDAMTTWHAHTVAVAPPGADPIDLDKHADTVMEYLEPYHGVTTIGEHRVTLSFTLDDIDAGTTPTDHALAVTHQILDGSGLGDWTITHVEVKTEDELDAELARPTFPELVGVTEAAEILGVSKQRVSWLAKNHPRFPRPAIELAAGPVWYRPAIDKWLETWDRKPGRPKTKTA